ncbi:MAG: TolC family protein [Candidatus Omnitrophica bacterium]|nr:TolC family protein [Candidatus Omnitrophota bacterium]
MLKKALLSFLIILLCLSPVILFGEGGVYLNSLIGEALNNNPQIQAAKLRYEAAKTRIRLLRTLQDPKFEYEYDKIVSSMISRATNESMAPMRTFSISQEFPFPTKLFLRRAAAQKEANAYEQEYKETERKVIKEVKEVYAQLYLSSKKIQLTNENLSLLSQFIEVANKKYSVNKANLQDALKAQVEYSKLSNQLVLLEQEEKIAQSRLSSLLNRSSDIPTGILEDIASKNLDLSEEKIEKLTKESRPELKSFKEMVRKSEIDYSLAKQEYLPDFMVKYKREERNGGMGSWAGTLGMTIPIWFWEKQDSFVREAKANVGVANADYRAEENVILFESKAALARFNAAKKLVGIYETGVLPQALAALQTAQRGYEADKISFLDLLDSLRTLKDFQMEYFEARANMENALADLERSVGTDLQSNSLPNGRQGDKS